MVPQATPNPVETQLRECYQACIARKVVRGDLSVRTRRGYQRLCSKYQPRLQFVSTADHPSKRGNAVNGALSLEKPDHPGGNDSEADSISLREVVGVFFHPNVLQLVADICWPLAHFGGNATEARKVSDWLELEETKYSTFMFHVLEWLFSGLPGVEAQDQAQRDWQHDREFDAFGNAGLSLEGFTVSLIDLAVACTDGSVGKSLEFLQQMADRLRHTLPTFRTPKLLESVEGAVEEDPAAMMHTKPAPDGILWQSIPLSLLMPCELRPQAQYYELKGVTPFLTPNWNPPRPQVLRSDNIALTCLHVLRSVELQLSTSAKLLVRERDSRTSIRRKTIALKAHFIELEHQSLWTFRDLSSAQPSLLLVPNAAISRRTKSLYACLRLLDSHERELHGAVEPTRRHSKPALSPSSRASTSRISQEALRRSALPLLTLFTSVPELCSLRFGGGNGLRLRIDRMTSRLFTIDHHERMKEPFTITLTTSLLQSTSSAGGAGAAATVSSSFETQSRFTVSDKSRHDSMQVTEEPMTAHTFVFVVKDQQKFSVSEFSAAAVQREETILPRQWFTSMSAANETKTIVIEPPTSDDRSDQSSDGSISDDGEDKEYDEYDTGTAQQAGVSGIYYLHIFTIHGIYCEAVYCAPGSSSESPSNKVNQTKGQQHDLQADQPFAALPDLCDRDSHLSEPAQIVQSIPSATHASMTALTPTNQVGTLNLQPEDYGKHDDMVGGDPSLTTSTSLLRRLLLLRKQRQRKTTANPPDVLTGTKVCTTKTITTAVALRAKVLRARQLERRARLEELEEMFREKLMQKYLHVRAPQRQRLSAGAIRSVSRSSDAESGNSNEIPELEARVNLLTTFFHEMAVHQPTLEELNGGTALGVAERSELQAEEKLLKHFGDLFEGDTTLQNALDEEKWSTEGGKITRRRASLTTNLPKGLLETETSQLAAARTGGDNAPLCFEDYENTARYIEQLFKDAAEHDSHQRHEREAAGMESGREAMAQLVVSWEYAQHRSAARQLTAQHLEQVEQRRRADWMQSHYVQAYGDAISARRKDFPGHPTLVPPKQRFLIQEQPLPWKPMWEVPGSPFEPRSTGAASPSKLEAFLPSTTECQGTRRPQSPAKRPFTASLAAPFTQKCFPHSAASRSATLARSHVRRIRSARNYDGGDARATQRPPHHSSALMRHQTSAKQEAENSLQRTPIVSYVPAVFLSLADTSTDDENYDCSDEASPTLEECGCSNNPGGSGGNKDAAVLGTDVGCPAAKTNRAALDSPDADEMRDPLVPNATAKTPKRKRRVAKKRRFGHAAEAARFRCSVRELVSIPLKLEKAAAEERERTEATEELASVHFTLPSRPGKKRPTI